MLQLTAPELLPPRKPNTAYTPFNLFDRVVAAASEAAEKDDARIQHRVAELKKELQRRKQSLRQVK